MLFSSLSLCRHSHIMRLLAPLGAALALAAFAAPAHAQSACDADTNDDGTVDSADLGTLLSAWGPCAGCSADLNRDGEVDSADLGALLSLWGESCVQGPAVTSVSPAIGPRWGGTEVVITGSNLGSVHEVVIGDRAAAILSVSETTLTVITAAGDVGPADVVVEAKGFATAAQMRLPTEAEWEYAYRAGTTTAFHGTPGNSIGFTDDAVVGAIAWFSGNSGSQTRPVGQKLPNGFGLYDMSGNVNEWVNEWFGSNYYAISPAVDPQGPAVGDFGARVYRGGGIISFSRWLRSAARNFNSPLVRAGYVGVRVVRDP